MNEVTQGRPIEPISSVEVAAHNPELFQPLTHEAVEARVQDALEQTEFLPSPELQEAIGGFYADHYALATVVSDSLRSGEEITDPLSSLEEDAPHAMKVQSEHLTRKAEDYRENPTDQHVIALIAEAARTTKKLFTETSVGITTITEAEILSRAALANQVLDFAKAHNKLWMFDSRSSDNGSDRFTTNFVLKPLEKTTAGGHEYVDKTGHYKVNGEQVAVDEEYDEQDVVITLDDNMVNGDIDRATDSFWNDVRRASHLEFHGTGAPTAPLKEGFLPRNEQIRRVGTYNHATIAAREDFSGGITRHHTNVPKFSEYMPDREYTGAAGGTFGVPIGDIIAAAPYARNAQFGEVAAKASQLDTMNARTPIEVVRKHIGAGGSESIESKPETSRQRAFFASPEEGGGVEPDGYAVEITGTGTSGTDPASETRVLFMYSDNPDEHNPGVGLPQGYQFPEMSVLSSNEDVQSQDANAEKILQVQARIAETKRFKNKFVIPLRRGVFSFVPEESDRENYPYAKANTYTQIARSTGDVALGDLGKLVA